MKPISNLEEKSLEDMPNQEQPSQTQPSSFLRRSFENAKIPAQYGLKNAEKYWQSLGPGLTTGAADDDPSGIATYSQAGAKFGFQFLWLAPLTFPLMAVVQEMCARIGMVTGRGLAGNIGRHFSKKILYITTGLLFFANTFNLGADLGAMAQAAQLLRPGWNFALLILFFGAASLGMQFFTRYKYYANYLKWLAVTLFAYIFAGLLLDIDGLAVLKGTFIPQLKFNKDSIFLLCAILGTTISPYLFFWQTSQEVEEEILQGKTSIKLRQAETSPEQIGQMRTDVWTGMFFSNLVMFFIMLTCAATLFQAGITNISTASEAASALRPLAGDRAFWLFTLGIIGTGLLAVPILAGGAAYALAETFGLKYGFYRKPKKAVAFYAIIALSMILGLLMNFAGLDPIKALIYSAVINGLISPVILYLIVRLSSDRKIMGPWKNGNFTNIIGWATVIIMSAVSLTTIATLLV